MIKAKRTWKEIEQTKEYRDAYNGAMEEGLSHTAATAFAKDSTAHLREYYQGGEMKTWQESHVTKRTRKEPNQDGVYVQESSGLTDESKKFVLKHLAKIGEVDRVEITWDRDDINYLTRIVGVSGSILVDGFSIGYSGSGPAGMYWLLNLVKLPYTEESIYGAIDNIGSRSWRQKKYPKEIVDCAACGFQFLCSPEDPEDLCECPECKKGK